MRLQPGAFVIRRWQGVEVGRQLTDNLRNTGFFNNTTTTFLAPFENPTINTPIVFRPSATDADNHLHTNLGAVYGQDQIELSRRLQVITGLRFDYFDLRFDNNRNGEIRRRIDRLVSPRVGVVFKPVEPLSRGWGIAGGYGYQDAFITSATTAARAGAEVAQVPHHTFSLWNSYQILPKLRAGLGIIHRSDMFAAVDNAVILPAYTRADVAVYYSLTERWRLQANLENLFDRKYFIHADGNNNISPGRPRGLRGGLTARF